MKIAISIPEDVFEAIERLASEQKLSRSQVITFAARDYIRKNETQRLLARLDKAYSGPETEEETARRAVMASYQRKRLRKK